MLLPAAVWLQFSTQVVGRGAVSYCHHNRFSVHLFIWKQVNWARFFVDVCLREMKT